MLATDFEGLVSFTLKNQAKGNVTDQVEQRNVLYRELKKKGRIKTHTGGLSYKEAIHLGGNDNFMWYEGYDTLLMNPTTSHKTAEFDLYQASTAVRFNGKEKQLNKGDAQIKDLLKSKIAGAQIEAANIYSEAIYSSGSAVNQFKGLAHFVQPTGLGTVGGIDSVTNPLWRNQFVNGAGTITAANIQQKLSWLMRRCGDKGQRGKTDLLLATDKMYETLKESLKSNVIYEVDDGDAEGRKFGMRAFYYDGAKVEYDSNASFGLLDEKIYTLNTSTFEIRVSSGRDWTQQPMKDVTDQDSWVIPILYMGGMTMNQRSSNGILSN